MCEHPVHFQNPAAAPGRHAAIALSKTSWQRERSGVIVHAPAGLHCHGACRPASARWRRQWRICKKNSSFGATTWQREVIWDMIKFS